MRKRTRPRRHATRRKGAPLVKEPHKASATRLARRRGISRFKSIDLTIYRCVQESLTNAIRHAQAGHVPVTLGEADETAIETALIDETVLAMEMTEEDEAFITEFTEMVKAWSDEAILAEVSYRAVEAEEGRHDAT